VLLLGLGSIKYIILNRFSNIYVQH